MPERLIFGRILLDIFLSLKTEWQNKKKKREKIPQSGNKPHPPEGLQQALSFRSGVRRRYLRRLCSIFYIYLCKLLF